MKPKSTKFESNPRRFSIALLLRFVMFLKEHVNMLLSQESEKNVRRRARAEICMNYMIDPESEIVNISAEL